MPLAVTEDTPPDMLAGAMDIKVLLPSGRTVSMSVERSTQMMDLLVQLTTTYKLSLAAHTTVALSDSGFPLHHLPSTPLGALDTRLIHIAQRTNTLKRAPLRPNNAQPFTTTFRLQVHLPRNQLFVTRVSPDTRLADILRLACSEKNLDPDKYELRHPANLCERLSLSHTLADYRLQEVTLVASRPPGAPLTPADIMALQREEEKRRQQVKKTGGIYSIIFNKRSKGVPEGSGSVSSDSLNGRSISPARSDESMERSVSPPEPVPPLRPGRKRRPAPKPPASAPGPPTVTDVNEGVDNKESAITLSHSRTSSDSSGYHEASVLSESPDTRTNSTAETLPRRSKLPTTNHIVAKNKSSTLQHTQSHGGSHNLSRSLSNLTAVGTTVQNIHSASTSSLASQGVGPRKKKAAPRPPTAVHFIQCQEKGSKVMELSNITLTEENPLTPSSQDNPLAPKPRLQAILDEEDTPSTSVNTAVPLPEVKAPLTPSSQDNPLASKPKLQAILDEEDTPSTSSNTDVALPEVEPTAILKGEHNLDPTPSRVEPQELPIASPDLVTSAIVHSAPDEEDDLPPALEVLSRNGELEDASEWQYHLPAPPSAFRDLNSPTTTEFETVVLADADVFRVITRSNKQSVGQDVPANHIDSDQSSHDGVQEDFTSVGSIYNESSISSSIQNDQSSKSSLASLKLQDQVVMSTEISAEADGGWEPQTIATAEKETRSNSKFNNGDLRLHQDGINKEVYKVNPIFNALHFEEDLGKSRITSTKYPQEENNAIRNINTSHRRSNPDLQSTNQLKNFTISTYHKPKNVDSIFKEDINHSPETIFKKPFVPPKHLVMARNNSFTTVEQDRPVPVIKRSTSHVSLARPYSKPSGFQSINRTKSISNLVLEEEGALSSLRKTTSEVNLNQGHDVPLQSLQVLKSILPRLSQSQVVYERSEAHPTGDQSQESHKQSCQAKPTRNTTDLSQKPYKQLDHAQSTHDIFRNSQESYCHQDQPRPTKENSQFLQNRESLLLESIKITPEPYQQPTLETGDVQVSRSETRPFVYTGPPAINFSTWSERPKIQVSLKSDRDYRMGKQTANTVQQASEESAINSSPKAKDTECHADTKRNEKEVSTKIEPIPLTMRIISHTAPSNYRSNSSLLENVVSPKTDPREERLPIVRAVELKKKVVSDSSVPLRSMSSTHLNGPNTNNVAHVPVNYHQGSFYNRYSYMEPGCIKQLGSVPNVTNPLTKSVSTTHMDAEVTDFGVSPGRKYMSVVGINGSGVVQSSSSNAARFQTTSKVDGLGPAKPMPNVKVNGFGSVKPMPTVKGFRFAGTEAANYDRSPSKANIQVDSYNNSFKSVVPDDSSHSTKRPLKTINGIENSKQKSNIPHSTSRAKVQHNTSAAHHMEEMLESRIPAPPKTPTAIFRNQSSRPMSVNANPRDQLLEAIKNFGGRESLKPAKTQSNVVLII